MRSTLLALRKRQSFRRTFGGVTEHRSGFPTETPRALRCLAGRWARAALASLAVLLLAPSAARAQFTRFESFSDEQGLGNNSVTTIGQDAAGFILLGTEAGLFRYDGSRITPYDEAFGLPAGSWIRRIENDRQGRVWVVTTNGLYVRETGRFRKVVVGRAFSVQSPHLFVSRGDDVVLDCGGTLLRASAGPSGIGRFAPLLDRATLAARPALARARFVAADGSDGLLVGCGDAICRIADGRVSVLDETAGLPPDHWDMALRTADGTLWARSLDRLAWRRPGERLFRTASVPGQRGQFDLHVPERLDLVPDRQGGVLTQNDQDILDWTGAAWRRTSHHAGGLAAAPIQTLTFDREGSLWVGSLGHGAFRALGFGVWEHWTAEDGLPSDIVWSMTRRQDGAFWVATYGDTVRLGGTPSSIEGGSENVVATAQDRLWLAPLDAPLVRLGPTASHFDRLAFRGRLSAMAVDGSDRLWLASDAGLQVVGDADAAAVSLHADMALPVPTVAVGLDPAARLWAVTADGLYRRGADGGFTRLASSAAIGDDAEAIAFTSNGEIWVATAAEGVRRFHQKDGALRALSTVAFPVVASNDILFLHRDRRGWMWVGTDHGLDLFDGRRWRHFDHSDGLVSNDMDQGAVYEDRDGSMWFGTSHGLTHLLDPRQLPSPSPLHPVITGLSMGARGIDLAPLVRLDWSAASLVIRFVDLDFTPGHAVSFRYRMRGLESGWNETAGHDVRYADLPAGRLRFELIAVDAAHGTMSAPVGFDLRVRAPWWRRPWFRASFVFGLVLVVAAAWQARVRLLLRHQRRLEAMVGARTAEIEHARSELQLLALSDVLSGLPNRRAILTELERAVAAASGAAGTVAVLLWDIDRFKSINDEFGHLAGDGVLASFGRRLGAAIRSPEAAGRYGGEEFCVILSGSRGDVETRVSAIRAAVTDPPFPIGGSDRMVSASGGLAFHRASDTALSLLSRADAALHDAKDKGRDRVECESDVATTQAGASARRSAGRHADDAAHASLARDLRDAIAREEFVLQYQPVFDTSREAVSGFEALLRWQSPTRGRVSPVEFIPFAEKIGLMPAIGDWVLVNACREAASWPVPARISVNLSPAQFGLPDLVKRIEAALRTSGLAPERLELELTETAMIENLDTVKTMLGDLRKLGIAVALDDFGTGYSSLSFLRTLPFDRIKIDKSFVQDLSSKPEASAIVGAILNMCRSLDVAVTAEGVETDEQIAALRFVGCTELQGYRISRPCAAADLGSWFAPVARVDGPVGAIGPAMSPA